MKRRMIALFMVLAMTVGLLAGCSKGSTTDSNQSNVTKAPENVNNTSEQKVEDSEGEYYTDDKGDQYFKSPDGKEYYVDKDGNKYQRFDDVKLTMLWNWNGGANAQPDQYNTEVATRIREKIGVTIEYEEVFVDETEKLNLVFASGQYPDIIETPYWGGFQGTTGVVKKAASDGSLIDLSGYIDNYNWLNQAYRIGGISQEFWNNDINIYGGPLYVMPARLNGSEAEYSVNNYNISVRADVAEKLGVDPQSIHTADDLYNFMKAADEYGFKDVNGNDTITVGTHHNGNYYYSMFTPFDDKRWSDYTLDDDGNVIHEYLDDDYFIGSNMFMWKLVNEGLMDVECFTQSKDLGKQKTGNGSVLFVCGKYDTTINSTIETGMYEKYPEMRYVPVGPLNYKTGEKYASLENAGQTGSHIYIFPETCSNIEAALTYIDYVSSPEGYLVHEAGIEGQDYSFDDKGEFHWSEENIAAKNEDSTAYEEARHKRGFCSWSAIAYNRVQWYGNDLSMDNNEYLDLFYSMVEVEFPTEDKTSIAAYFKDFEGYNDLIAIALDGGRHDDMVQRAFFAKTEEEARKILKEYQDYVLNTEGFKEFLQYLTEIYKSNPDKIHF